MSAGSDVIAQQRAQFFENQTLDTFVPMPGTFFISSHDKRLPEQCQSTAQDSITLRRSAVA